MEESQIRFCFKFKEKMNIFNKTVISIILVFTLTSCGGGGKGTEQKVAQPAFLSVLPVNGVYEEDLSENITQSTPDRVNIPKGLDAVLDIEYLGAFRVEAGGEPEGTSSSYAVGTLGYNSDNDSLYLAGHAHHNGIAEFKVPDKYGVEEQITELPLAPVLQNYTQILNKKNEGKDTNKINGILLYKSNLIVTSEISYDAAGTNEDNMQLFKNAYDLKSSPFEGMLQLEGKAKAAGYMSQIPTELQSEFQSQFLVGWASNYSITSRYSQGPSLYTFDPQDVVDVVPSVDKKIKTEVKQVYHLSSGKELVEDGAKYTLTQSPIWGSLARAVYGFIIPNTRIFMAIGRYGGLHSGVGYKITQDNGNLCGGPCSYEASDYYNYFWLYNVDDILDAEEPYLTKPFSYGKWSHPYDQDGTKKVLGATYDMESKRLFISLSHAGQIGLYDRPPLILVYNLEAKLL